MAFWRGQHWVLGIVALALLTRALIPLGYMPDLGALTKGQIQMVVCTGSGPQTVAVPSDFDPLQPAPHQQAPPAEHGVFCSVGLVLQAADLPVGLFILILIVFGQAVTVYVVPPVLYRRFYHYGALFPTGPPPLSLN